MKSFTKKGPKISPTKKTDQEYLLQKKGTYGRTDRQTDERTDRHHSTLYYR